MPALTVGEKVPAFALPDADGESRRLEEFLGRPLVLYFYPADFTPGCTRQAKQFRDALAKLDALGARVVGVSRDAPGKHAEFAREHKLGYTLLSDEDGKVCDRYGVLGVSGRPRRVTFVLDETGRILERIASPLPATHVRKALKALEALWPREPARSP